jgi:hypothetical protein
MSKINFALWSRIFVLGLVVILGFVILVYPRYVYAKYESLGVKAVKCLYEFGNIDAINTNMVELRKIVSSDVYDSLTVDNVERVFSVWLKFKGEPTFVNIIESSDKFVVYSVSNPNIAEERRFIFSYDIGGNKIVSVAEAELVVFSTTSKW